MPEQKKNPVRLQLTEDQKKMIREATGQEADSLEFDAEELEDRVAPARFRLGVDI